MLNIETKHEINSNNRFDVLNNTGLNKNKLFDEKIGAILKKKKKKSYYFIRAFLL